MISDVRKPAGLFAIVAALAVLSAGCIVQDRPHEGGLSVVADAGQNKVIAVGDTAHFEWAEDHALKAEGGVAPPVDVTYSWKVGEVVESVNHTVAVSRAVPEFVLVELNITAKEQTASDAAGVLFVPVAQDASRHLFVATVGFPRSSGAIIGDTGVPVLVSGEQTGSLIILPIEANISRLYLRLLNPEHQFPPEPIRGSLLFAVKDGVGVARSVVTGSLEFDSENAYTLSVDLTPAANDTMEVRDADGQVILVTTLEAFEAAHPAEEAVEVPVIEAQAGLPGFEGLAAVATIVVLGAVLIAARRRL